MSIAFSPISGPDCGRVHSLHGRSAVGRASSSTITIADPALAGHHVIVDADGSLKALATISADIVCGERHLRAGSSRFVITDAVPERPRDPGEVVVRPARRASAGPPTESEPAVDPPRPAGSGVVMAVTMLAGSAVIAMITGSWMFLAFGSVGLVTNVSNTAVDRIRHRRAERRRQQAEDVAELQSHRDRRPLWPVDLVERPRTGRLWVQRSGDPVNVVIGVVDLEGLCGAPITIDLGTDRVIAIRAEAAIGRGVLRSLVAQAIVACGPADLDVLVDGSLLGDLPMIDTRANGTDDGRRLLIVTDDRDALVHADTVVRRLLDSDRHATCICVIPTGDVAPVICDDVIDIGSDWTAIIDGRDGIIAFDAAGMTVETWSQVLSGMFALVDPEDPDRRRRIPTRVENIESAPGPADLRSATAILGASADGPLMVDLVADGPHALVAGTTGSGKSELLRTLITSLCRRHDPDTLTFLLIDHKGGAAFDELGALPHVVGVVTDLEGELVDRVLASLEAEVRRREVVLRGAGVADLADMVPGPTAMARLVIVVDEFAALSAAAPHALGSLIDIARRGRSLGMHLVLATQRPAGVVDDAVRSNTNIRIALRLQDRNDALDVVGDERAATLDRSSPGRAMIRIGSDSAIEFQTAVTGAIPVDTCVDRWRSKGLGAPHRPWADPLPTLITEGVGLIDACDEQCHLPLTWKPSDGNLAVIGPVGSGTTTALVTLAAALDEASIYVLDGRSDRRLVALSELGCAAPVVAARDRERVDRLLRRVAGEVEARRSIGVDGMPLVLMIDGIAEVLRAIDHPGRPAIDDLELILEEGPAVNVVTVVAGGPVRRDLRTAVTWTVETADRPGRIITSGGTGRSRVAQVAKVEPSRDATRPTPPSIEVLPTIVDAGLISGTRTGSVCELVLGIDAVGLDPARITVPDGEHLLVVGPSRSGRTTALQTIARSWMSATGGEVTMVGRRDDLGSLPILNGPHLVMIDDAARLDDIDGSFTNRLEDGEPGLFVVAAGHADALRSRFGHWTSVIRRSRRGLVMSSAGEGDGDLIGAALPMRPPLPARPGLAWVCIDGNARLAQIATCDRVPVAAMLER